jgi:hypothetical protein
MRCLQGVAARAALQQGDLAGSHDGINIEASLTTALTSRFVMLC